VVANQFGAALKAAGHTLDAEQQTSLNRIMKVFAAKDQNLRLAEGDRELKLENLAEETELKHQFYAEAKGLLNADQRAALYDSKTEGRAQFDMFDPGLMLGQFARPVPASDAKSFAAAAGSTYKAKLGISGKAGEQLDAVVAEWSRNYPPAYWESKADSLEQNRMMKTDRIRTALNRQLDLTRMIMSKVDLTPAQRKQLAQSQMVLVPLPN
jgi:hypothetical protein